MPAWSPAWSATWMGRKPGDDFMFFGSRSLYQRVGFTEVVRRSPTRVVMRRNLRRASAQAPS